MHQSIKDDCHTEHDVPQEQAAGEFDPLNHICWFDFIERTEYLDKETGEVKSKPVRRNKIDDVMSAFESRQHWRLDTYSDDDLYGHAAEKWTLYYTSRNDRWMLMVDVDCHHYGSPQDALSVCRWLRDNWFDGMHFEPSTSGTGAHGYILVDARGVDSRRADEMVKEIQHCIDAAVRMAEFDVELVEIKGTATRQHWRGGEIQRIEFGAPAKLPRDLERIPETTRLTLVELHEICTTEIHQLDEELEPKKKPGPKPKSQVMKRGSGGCRSPITRAMVEAQYENARTVIEANGGSIVTACKKRMVCGVERVAASLAIEEFKNRRPFARNGANPTARTKTLHKLAYESGAVTRAYDESCAAAIRVATRQFTEVISDYFHYVPEKPGTGIARRWRVDFDLITSHREFIDGATGVKPIPSATRLTPSQLSQLLVDQALPSIETTAIPSLGVRGGQGTNSCSATTAHAGDEGDGVEPRPPTRPSPGICYYLLEQMIDLGKLCDIATSEALWSHGS